MATLLLFAAAREAAGVGRMSMTGDTAAEVLRSAVSEIGESLERLLPYCSVHVDGERVKDPETALVSPTSEVALLPPVSGGAL